MSLRQIAKQLGVSAAYLSMCINWKRPWPEALRRSYVNVVNTPVNTFVNSDGDCQIRQHGVPGRIRTRDPLLRRQPLCPAELLGRIDKKDTSKRYLTYI